MCFQPIRALLNTMRNEPESLQTYNAYARLRMLCPMDDTREELIFAFADLLEEHVTSAWDYEIPHRCQFDMPDSSTPAGVSDCRQPAPFRVFWLGHAHMWVCQEHFEFIRKAESEYKAQQVTV